MAQRKKPYTVGIPTRKMPPSSLSLVETLLALDKATERYVRNYTGHPKLQPVPPFVTLTLASGKEVCGLLRQATEQAVAIFPQKVWGTAPGLGVELKKIAYDTPIVLRMSSLDMVEFFFPSHRVDPEELTS